MKLQQTKQLTKYVGWFLIGALTLGSTYVYATVTQAGYCWNDKVGWVNMSGVDYDRDTRQLDGIATYFDGKYLSNVLSDGEIDFTFQSGTELEVLAADDRDGNGNWPLLGQAFSEQIGWTFVDHGTDPATYAAITASGELTGNFWSNEIGWIGCTGAEIGAGNAQIWDITSLVISAGDPDSSTDELTIAENGGEATFEVSLGSQPASPVMVVLTLSTPNQAGLTATRLNFSVAEWETPRQVRVIGVNDSNIGNEAVTIELSIDPAVSDPAYHTLATRSIAVTLIDDDSTSTDTDGDGVPDSQEILDGTDVGDPTDYTDTDGDGVPDYVETSVDGTDPKDSSSVLDTDGDGIPDYLDPNPNTPGDVLTDTDGDGVPDVVETNQGTNPNDSSDFQDTDGDGVPDYVEGQEGTDSNDDTDFTDTDGDGVPDYVEENSTPATDPNDDTDFTDTDGDGVPDYVEDQDGTNSNDPTDYTDTDGDGVPDYVEENSTPATDLDDSSSVTDTDGDGIPDYLDPNPNTPGDVLTDTDGDGVPDIVEQNQGTNPNDDTDFQDTDGDGVPDYVEGTEGTDSDDNSSYLDSDGDGVPDHVEVHVDNTDPNDSSDVSDQDGDGIPDYLDPNPGTGGDTLTDTDGDGVPDLVEQNQGTNPNDPDDFQDTDGDGVPDYVEGQDGTDSNDANDFLDSDNDGVADIVEDNGFNGGDSDGDGVADSAQQNVSPTNNPVTGDSTTLRADGACTFITENAALAESSLATSDASADYPVGLVDFQVNCVTPGDSSDVTIYYGQEYDTSTWTYKKFDGNGNVYSDITSIVTFGTHTYTVGPETGNTVTTASFTVTDGDPLTDEDTGPANGVINDPSGPAIVVTSSSSSSGGSSGNRKSCRDPEASNYERFGTHDENRCEYDDEEETEEPTVEITVDQSICSPHLTKNIGALSANDSDEVKKLQEFLNDEEGEDLEVDGIYGEDDIAAVKRFQEKYSKAVLDIWGLSEATGYVGITTRNKINSFFCDADIQCPYFTEYNSTTQNNNSNEVLKTKILLTELGFYNGELNESWGTTMRSAMITFQETFSATMLKPWGLSKGTGYKYKTTNKFMNELVGCTTDDLQLENGATVSY